MHTDHKTDPLVELGYEQKDIHPKNIFKVSMIFFAFTFFSYILAWAILHYGFNAFPDSTGVNDLRSTKIPKSPNPILQTNVTAKTAIKDMRIEEAKVLNSTGESAYAKGAHRISIEQAIKLSAERGAKLPAQEGGQ